MWLDFWNTCINNIFSLVLRIGENIKNPVSLMKYIPYSMSIHWISNIYVCLNHIYLSLLARYKDVKESGIYIYIYMENTLLIRVANYLSVETMKWKVQRFFWVNSCTFAVRQNHQDVKQWMRVVHIMWSRDQPYLWPPVSFSCVSYHRK